jgi:hypothetical protein
MAKTYRFDVTPDSLLADLERESPTHPVFRFNTLTIRKEQRTQ